jgi:hypothetical protein
MHEKNTEAGVSEGLRAMFGLYGYSTVIALGCCVC